MKKYFRNLSEKVERELYQLNPGSIFFFLLFLFLPTQLGLHFWPTFSYVNGVRVDYLSPTFYFTDFIAFCFFILNLRKLKLNKKFLNILFLLTASFIINFLVSHNKGAFFYGVIKITEFSFLILVLAQTIKSKIYLLPISLSLGIIFESFLAIAQTINQGSLNGIFYFFGERTYNGATPNIANASLNGELFLRPYGSFSHPNVLAAFLFFSLIITVTLINYFKGKRRILFWTSVLIGTFALTITLSRLPIILWISFCFLEIFIKVKFKKKYILLGFSFITLILIALTSLKYRLTFVSISESISERIILYRSVIKLISENVLFGVGINNFYEAVTSFLPKNASVFPQPVHNIFLLIFSETGLIGLAGFIMFIIKAFIDSSIFEIKFLITSVVLLGMFDHYFLTIQQGQLILAVVFALALSKITRKDV